MGAAEIAGTIAIENIRIDMRDSGVGHLTRLEKGPAHSSFRR
jgi:hypothetical protein